MFKNLVGALALALPVAVWAQAPSAPSPRSPVPPPLKVGFVYVSPVGSAGWSYQHEQGRLALQQALGDQVVTTRVEGVPEGADAERVMRELAREGHRLIFATSFGYLEPALRVAADFPGVVIEHAGGHKTAPNLNTYNARYYEARWLAGWLAGKTSRSGTAGYVAGFAVPEVIQGLNAFTLGLRAANPQGTVRVVWLNTWFDPAREREAAATLVRQGADVLTNHSGSPAVPQAAQELGVKVIAYQSDMKAFAPTAQLAAVTHHWGAYYTEVAKKVLAGTWTPTPLWAGLADGLVRLEALSPALPKEVVDGLRRSQRELVDGRRKPFAGPLVDSQGRQRVAPGAALTDAQIARMDWLVQGVVSPPLAGP